MLEVRADFFLTSNNVSKLIFWKFQKHSLRNPRKFENLGAFMSFCSFPYKFLRFRKKSIRIGEFSTRIEKISKTNAPPNMYRKFVGSKKIDPKKPIKKVWIMFFYHHFFRTNIFRSNIFRSHFFQHIPIQHVHRNPKIALRKSCGEARHTSPCDF